MNKRKFGALRSEQVDPHIHGLEKPRSSSQLTDISKLYSTWGVRLQGKILLHRSYGSQQSTQAGYWGKEPPGAFWERGVGQQVAVPGWCLIKQNRRQMEDFLPSPSHFSPSFCSTPRLLLDLGGLHCLVVLELTCLNNKSTLLDRIKQTIRKSINQLVSAAGRGQGRGPRLPGRTFQPPNLLRLRRQGALSYVGFHFRASRLGRIQEGRNKEGVWGSMRFLQSWR